MKNYKPWFFLFLILFCSSVSYSQTFTTGVSSGINFSDIHGQDTGGKWVSDPGPSESLSFGYSINKSLGIQTGINFFSVYYDHKYPSSSGPIYYPYDDYIFMPTYNYNSEDKMNFSFLRIPLLVTVSIPSSLQFNLRTGIFFSFLQDYSLSSNNYNFQQAAKPKKIDFGYIFSSGISYPLTDNIRATVNINYLTGRKQFLENYSYRHGSSEFMLGFEYAFLKKTSTSINQKSGSDSSSKKITITYRGGINYSWNSYKAGTQKYTYCTGPSLGFSVNFPIGKGVEFITGFSFERMGYSMKDSSSSFFRYMKSNDQMYYVDTKVLTDYAVIPFLLNMKIGNAHRVFLNSGPWFGLKLNARNVGVAYSETRSESNYTFRKTVVYDDIEKLVKNNDIGWIFGGGVSLPLFGKSKVAFALQYRTGFKNVFNKAGLSDQQNSAAGDYGIKYRTLSFLIGITLPSANH